MNVRGGWVALGSCASRPKRLEPRLRWQIIPPAKSLFFPLDLLIAVPVQFIQASKEKFPAGILVALHQSPFPAVVDRQSMWLERLGVLCSFVVPLCLLLDERGLARDDLEQELP